MLVVEGWSTCWVKACWKTMSYMLLLLLLVLYIICHAWGTWALSIFMPSPLRLFVDEYSYPFNSPSWSLHHHFVLCPMPLFLGFYNYYQQSLYCWALHVLCYLFSIFLHYLDPQYYDFSGYSSSTLIWHPTRSFFWLLKLRFLTFVLFRSSMIWINEILLFEYEIGNENYLSWTSSRELWFIDQDYEDRLFA